MRRVFISVLSERKLSVFTVVYTVIKNSPFQKTLGENGLSFMDKRFGNWLFVCNEPRYY